MKHLSFNLIRENKLIFENSVGGGEKIQTCPDVKKIVEQYCPSGAILADKEAVCRELSAVVIKCSSKIEIQKQFREKEIKKFLIEQLGIDPEKQAEEIMKGWEARNLSQIPGFRLPTKAQILNNLYEIYKGPDGRKKLEGLEKLATKPELVIAIDVNLLELIEKLDANRPALQIGTTYVSPFIKEQWGNIQVPSPIEFRLGIVDVADNPRVMGKDTDMRKTFEQRAEINQKQLAEYGLEFADSRVYFAGATNVLDRGDLIDTQTYTLFPTDPASTKERFAGAYWRADRLSFRDDSSGDDVDFARFRAFGGGKMKY